MAASKPISMRLIRVDEIKFAMVPSTVGEEDRSNEMELGFMSQLHPDLDRNLFCLQFGCSYKFKGTVVLESVLDFVFEVEELASYVSVEDDGRITVSGLMPHMVSVAVGTIRGVLISRTAGTTLARYPIPMIDPVEICNRLKG